MNRDEIEKLLEGTTPGPWTADGNPQNRIVWSPDGNRVCFMAHSSGLNDDGDIANSNLVAAAPNLARTVIALHAQLADAKAAQALVVERAARDARDVFSDHKDAKDAIDYMEQLIYAALADPSGVEALAALRAEAGKMLAEADNEYSRKTNDIIERHAKQLADLRARLAAAEAQVGALREALELADATLVGANMDMKHVWRKVKSALAEVQEDDPPCTCCDGTGITKQTERFCSCEVGRAALAPAAPTNPRG